MNRRADEVNSAQPAPANPRRILGGMILHLLLLAAAFLVLTPFLWMLCASLKNKYDVVESTFVPWKHLHTLSFDNFRILFRSVPFERWLINSLFLSSITTVLVVTLSSLGGFALAKYRFAGKRPLMALMLGTMLMPAIVLLPSSYELMYRFGWLNSYAAIVVPGAVSAFGMFLFRAAMMSVPDELLHAGRVDGCSELRLWWDVALPIVRPMIGAYTLLSFLAAWNSYLWPQVILQDQAKYTLPVGLAGMLGLPEFETQYGVLMAGATLAVLPVLFLFIVLQRDFIAGLTSGAVKG